MDKSRILNNKRLIIANSLNKELDIPTNPNLMEQINFIKSSKKYLKYPDIIP